MKTVMKNILTTAVAGSMLMSSAALAQQKLAVVDVQAVFQAMPQAAEISEKIQLEFKDQIEEVNQLQRDGQFFAERLQRDAATMSEKEKQDLQQKMIDVRDKLAEKGQPLQQNIQRRSNEERNKLLALIKQAIDAVAAKEGYDMILNSSSVTFAKDNLDLSEKVLQQVNKIN